MEAGFGLAPLDVRTNGTGTMSWLMIVVTLAGALLLVLLAAATGNTSLFAGRYDLLIQFNVAVAALMGALVLWQIGGVVRARIDGRFGSRLTMRFLLLFALMAMVPGALVYSVSVGFLARSIESWFDVRVDNALAEGLNLGRAVLDIMLDDLDAKAHSAAQELADLPLNDQERALSRLREQTGADEMLLIGTGGILSSVSRSGTLIMPNLPSPLVLRQARSNRHYRGIESNASGGLILRSIYPIQRANLADEVRFLDLSLPVPSQIARSAEAVQSVNRDYRELALTRGDLRRTYIFALTLTLLLALLSAVVLAVLLSRRLSAPLATLAEATEAVARGDFSRRAAVLSGDELGTLARSFNSMTEQLDAAYRSAEENRQQEQKARAYLENILTNLSTGVIVLDARLHLRTCNAAAADILECALADYTNHALEEVPGLSSFAQLVSSQFALGAPWQRQLELAEGARVLMVRGSLVAEGDRTERLIVFDEVTTLIQAQRATAWAEVAQRLAHEIKNPLTPIQLAIERLRMKFADRLAPADAQALDRAADTIITQVNAMKSMVDEFRVYARLPRSELAPVDLNQVIEDTLSLYESVRESIVFLPGPSLPRAIGDLSQLRQVVHNLLQNAQDAMAPAGGGKITIETGVTRNGVLLRISDSGSGFSEGIIQRAFEPYVTTKPRGTGLGLAIVKKIIDEHQGTVELANQTAGGAQVSIVLRRAATGEATPTGDV